MNDHQIEQEIQAKGLTAPRITPADIEANIASEFYFTAADGIGQVTDEMVTRFLSWRLPQHFYPDCHISFDREKASQTTHSWPVGTNLLNADQARSMLKHILQLARKELTICD